MMEPKKKLGKPLFIIDSSVLVKIFEGDRKSNDMIAKLFKLKEAGMPFEALTTLGSFMRALWQADDNATIRNVHDAMELLDIGQLDDVGFSGPDYKNGQAIINEIIELADVVSGGGKINIRDMKNGEKKPGDSQ